MHVPCSGGTLYYTTLARSSNRHELWVPVTRRYLLLYQKSPLPSTTPTSIVCVLTTFLSIIPGPCSLTPSKTHLKDRGGGGGGGGGGGVKEGVEEG